MNSEAFGILAGAVITASPALAPRWAGNSSIRHIALGAGGLALAAGGLHVNFFSQVWLDVALTVAWVVAVGAALDQPAGRRGLMEGLGAVASATYLALALMYGQRLAAWLGAGSLLVSLLLLGTAAFLRPGQGQTGRWVLGFGLAASGIAVSFPGRPALSTALIPAVVLGLPLANLIVSLAWRARMTLWANPQAVAPAQSLAGRLGALGWSDRQAAGLLWGCGVLLGGSGVLMSRLDPFAANALALLAGAACAAAMGARSIAGLGRAPILIYGLAGATLLAFIFSLRYHFLDFVFVGTHSGYQGFDFFQMPCAFYYGARGISPYGVEGVACEYAPWATPFQLHPLAAIVPGAILYAMPPWTAYSAFVAFSIAAVLGLGLLFARLTPVPLTQSLIFLFLAASWPLYLVLWMGQAQIYVLLSFGLIAYALLRQPEGWSRRASFFLIVGLLAGLLTKPLFAPIVVVLLVAKETRRATVIGLAVYGLLSLALLAIPALNPGGRPLAGLLNGTETLGEYVRRNGNLGHWVYMALSNPRPSLGDDPEIFSPVETVSVAWPRNLPGVSLRLGAGLAVLFQAWAVATARTSAGRLRQLRLASVLAALMYPVFYSKVYEYHYATLAVAPVVFLLMLPDAPDRPARFWLAAGLAAYVPFLLPSIFPLVTPNAPADLNASPAQAIVYRAFRALPAVLVFCATGLVMLRYRLSGTAQPIAAAARLEG